MKRPPLPISRPNAFGCRLILLWGLLLMGLLGAGAAALEPRKVGDINSDGELSVVDLTLLRRHVRGLEVLSPAHIPFADVNADGVVNEDDGRALIRLLTGEDSARALPLTGIRETNPSNGEESVSSSRRTGIIVRFSMPVEPFNGFNDRSVFGASVNGVPLNSRAELSSDGRKLALFVTDKIPGSTRVDVSLNTAGIRDLLGREIDGDGDGKPGGVFKFYYLTESLVVVPNTEIKGRVFASEKRDGQNVPLKGVIVRVAGTENAQVLTDENGAFTLACPAGRFFAEVDGRKVLGENAFPDKAYYPFVVKAWEAVAGSKENLAVGTGEIFLPLIPAGALKVVDPNKETKVEAAPSVVAANPALAEISLSVPAGALRKEDGTGGGRIGMAPVPADRLPEPLAPGLNFPLVITIQTDGAGTFDQPVAVKFPNLPDQNGVKLAAGEKTGLWSFNHDTGSWELQGPMTVTDDGNYVTTDPGVGVRQPGWHGVLPGSQGIGPKRAASAPALPKAVHKEVDNALKTAAQSSLPVRDAFMLLGQMRGTAEDLEAIVRMLQEIKSLVAGYNQDGTLPYWWSTYWLKLRIAKLKPSYDRLLPTGDRNLTADLTALQPWLASIKAYLTSLEGFNKKAYAASDSYTWLSTQFADSNAALLGMLNELQPYLEAIKPAAAGFSTTAFDDVANVLFPGFGQPDPTREQEIQALSKFLAAMETVSTSIRLDHSRRFKDINLQMSDYLARAGALSIARSAPFKYGYIKVDAIGEPQRIRSNAAGDYRMVLPPNREFSVTYVDPRTLQVGVYVGISGSNGTVTDLYGPVLAPLQPNSADAVEAAYALDTDKDKLANELELVIGTNVGTEKVGPTSPRTFADTDGDGISDYLEVIRGKNPVSGLAVGTGVIFSASASQPGFESTDVDAGNELLLLSERKSDGTAKGGLMVYSLEDKTEPLRQAWLPTEYPVYRVRYADTNLAILSLRENGVAVVDLSSPTSPVLKYTYPQESGESVSSAILVGDILVLGVNNASAGTAKIVLKSLETGALIREETAGASISDLVANGTVVYALSRGNKSANQWWWYWNATTAVFVGDVNRVSAVPEGGTLFRSVTVREWEYSYAGGRLALAPGKLFYVHESGLSGLNITDPLNPKVEGNVYNIDSGFQRGWNHAAFDGSVDAAGKMTFLASVGSNPAGDVTRSSLDGDVTEFQYGKAATFGNSGLGWWRYWLTNDTPITQLQKPFESRISKPRIGGIASGAVSSLVLAGGIVYAADKEEGLKVVNYKKYDSQGLFPAVVVSTNSPSPKRLQVPRALAGSLLSLTAAPSDDIAVASVEWYVDGARVAITGGSPWGYTMRLPQLDPTAAKRYRLEARVYDTGGNMTSSSEFLLDVVADPFPPTVVSVAPDSTLKEVTELNVVFSEPMDSASLKGSLKVRTPGADKKFGTADDEDVDLKSATLTADGAALKLSFAASLPEGSYRATLEGSVTDLAGNPLGEDYTWNFGVSLANRWLGGLGLWSDATKWSSGAVPNLGEDVIFPQYQESLSPNVIVAGRSTFQPPEGTLIAGTTQLTRVLTKAPTGGWWYYYGSQNTQVPAGAIEKGMLVTGSMIAEGTYIKNVTVTEDRSDLLNIKQTTVLELSKPLDATLAGALPWTFSSAARLGSVLVEGETNVVDVDMEIGNTLTLSANLGFGGASTLGVGTVETVVAGSQIRSAAAVNTGSLVAGKTDTGAANLRFTRPLLLNGDLALESAGFRSEAGKLTSSRLQLASPLELAGHELRIYGGYAGSVALQPTVGGGTFTLIGSGTLAFDWKESLFEEQNADWDKLSLRATTGSIAIPEDVKVAVAGMGKVRFFARAIANSGVVELDELAHLSVYNYTRVGEKSQERLGRDAVLEKLTYDSEAQPAGLFATTNGGFMAIKEDGSLWATGYNYQGRLGTGTLNSYVTEPSQVGTGTWAFVAANNADSYYGSGVSALKQDGSLWSWGGNWWYGDIVSEGSLRTVPTQVGEEKDWKVLSASYYSTFALKQDGSLWAWGYNYNGELGVGGSMNTTVTSPARVGADSDWKSVYLSQDYDRQVFALKKDGSLWGWGQNYHGALGVGGSLSTTVTIPTQIGSDKDWTSLSAAYYSTFALKQDGSLWAWGTNWNGRLGLGGSLSTSVSVPTQVGTDRDWKAVSTSGNFTFALKQDGSLWAWGYNWNGRLGVGSSESYVTVPTPVLGNGVWRGLPVYGGNLMGKYDGYGWVCIQEDGTLWEWGNNIQPRQVGADSDWDVMARPADGNGYTPCYLFKQDGTFWRYSGYYKKTGTSSDQVEWVYPTEPELIETDVPWRRR